MRREAGGHRLDPADVIAGHCPRSIRELPVLLGEVGERPPDFHPSLVVSAQGQTVITTTLCLTTAFPTQKIRHNGYRYYEVEYEWSMAPQVNPFRQISPNMTCAYRERNERRERFPMMNFCDSQ